MENEPGRNGEVALFDLDGDQVEGARCEGPDCEEPLPPREGRGRRLRYHSQACKSRADRVRVKARTAVGLPGPAKPAAAAATPQERPAAGLPVERQRVLGAADAIRKRTEAFLAAVDDDPMGAHTELSRQIYALASRLVTSARDVRDAVRWPGLDADARTEARIREEWNLPDAAPGDQKTDRRDFPVPLRDPSGTGETPRGENSAASTARPAAPKTPRGETTADLALDVLHRADHHRAAAGHPAALVAPVAAAGLPGEAPIPKLVLGRTTGWTPPTDRGLGEAHRDYALGDGLVHLTWPGKPGVQALERRGCPAGWTELYDDRGHWAVLIDGRLVVDAANSRPWVSTNADDAVTLLRLALDQGLAAPDPARPLPRVHE
ncbi:hypothetical protein ACIQOV_28385 [Kitasatospora sp. NPDC091257]|uniref:hypothetical protein n=1 Tax=Kitasatospora sp. NPDC091257 TaxID=3364084 RepID=UPI0037FAAB5F